MPKYVPSDEEMDSETYGPAKVEKPGESKPTEAKPSVDDEEAMSDTAMLPTKILSPEGEPLAKGDEIVVQVVSVHGDETIVKYAPKKGGSEEGDTTVGNEDSEIAALDQKGY